MKNFLKKLLDVIELFKNILENHEKRLKNLEDLIINKK